MNPIGSRFQGHVVVGDVKGEDRINDTHSCLIDLLRIGMLSGGSINQEKYDGIVCVHVVGVQMTFYIVSLMASGVYVMLEICSITLPKDFTEIRSYIANMDDLFPVMQYYNRCSNTTNKASIDIHCRQMMSSPVFKIITDNGKDRKRLCTIVYNH